jgi:hypothetical protein
MGNSLRCAEQAVHGEHACTGAGWRHIIHLATWRKSSNGHELCYCKVKSMLHFIGKLKMSLGCDLLGLMLRFGSSQVLLAIINSNYIDKIH